MSLDLTTHTSLSPIRRGFAPGFVNYKKGCTRLAAASDKIYQLLAHVRWFSPGSPSSSTTKTGRHDITEILLKKSKSIECLSVESPLTHLIISRLLFPGLQNTDNCYKLPRKHGACTFVRINII